MGLFGKIVKTVVNVATLPIDVVKDVATLGGDTIHNEYDGKIYTGRNIEQIKREADDE